MYTGSITTCQYLATLIGMIIPYPSFRALLVFCVLQLHSEVVALTETFAQLKFFNTQQGVFIQN